MIAMLIATPATAWDMHALAHASVPVAANEHHHHGDDGSVHVEQAPANSEDKRDGNRGHDHMPSLVAAWTAMVSDGPVVSLPAPTAMPHRVVTGHAPPDPFPDREIRPPRFA